MSIIRTKHRQINNSVLLQNRLSVFTNPPMRTGDLYVEKDETVGGNLDISGNLIVRHDLDVSGNLIVRSNLYVTQNETVGGNVDVSGNISVQNNLRATNYYATGNYYLDNYVFIPPGTIIHSAAINEPAGWFDCDGRVLNRSLYPDLFNAVGYAYSTIYGNTDLSFNIPDMRGRVVVGLGTGSGLTARNLGSNGGEETHVLTVEEIPSHSHSLTRRINPDDGAFDTGNGHVGESSAATTDREIQGTFSTFNTGGSSSHNNMQPFITLRNLIKY